MNNKNDDDDEIVVNVPSQIVVNALESARAMVVEDLKLKMSGAEAKAIADAAFVKAKESDEEN